MRQPHLLFLLLFSEKINSAIHVHHSESVDDGECTLAVGVCVRHKRHSHEPTAVVVHKRGARNKVGVYVLEYRANLFALDARVFVAYGGCQRNVCEAVFCENPIV